MPSPFPGMDPWLEAPHLWPGMHHKLLTGCVETLQAQLNSHGYYCDLGERVWLSTSERAIYPDTAVFAKPRRPRDHTSTNGGVLVADEPVRVRHVEVEVTQAYLEIFEASGDRLVTGIEFLSPANKEDATGRDLYRKKHGELREAGVHLVEIDLIRRGPHVLDVPRDVVEEVRPWEYLVNLVRRGSGEYQLYPIRLRQKLPKVAVPLKAGDADAVLDLQAVFDRAYDIGPYRMRVDYTKPPFTPLSDDDARWAEETLRSQGLHP